MSEFGPFDEERLGKLLQDLPPAPTAWVRAAVELPPAREELDDLVERAIADAEFRRQTLADLEAALAAAGIQPSEAVMRTLQTRLAGLS